MTVSPDLMQQVALAKALIMKNVRYHFTIYSLSMETGINEFTLKRGFKAVYGMGLYECLIEARMEKGIPLLLETDKPFKEISYLCGYKHEKNFIAAFRKRFRLTPLSYRKVNSGLPQLN